MNDFQQGIILGLVFAGLLLVAGMLVSQVEVAGEGWQFTVGEQDD